MPSWQKRLSRHKYEYISSIGVGGYAERHPSVGIYQDFHWKVGEYKERFGKPPPESLYPVILEQVEKKHRVSKS